MQQPLFLNSTKIPFTGPFKPYSIHTTNFIICINSKVQICPLSYMTQVGGSTRARENP